MPLQSRRTIYLLIEIIFLRVVSGRIIIVFCSQARESSSCPCQSSAFGDQSFFLGTDSAPHLDTAKLMACGCAGIYTSPNTMSCLAHIFEGESALDRLEGFTSLHGPAFQLPINKEQVTC